MGNREPTRRRGRRRGPGPALAMALLATLGLVACGGDGEGSTSTSSATSSAPDASTAPAPQPGTGPDGGGSASAPGDAHIDLSSGSDNGLRPDERLGAPPSFRPESDLEHAASDAGCVLGLRLPDEGSNHLAPQDPIPEYGTNPPTSGDHAPVPQADGAYLDTPEATAAVHSLEHGRVEVQYQPSLDERDQLAIKGLFDADPEGTLLYPNPGMPYELAATAWTNLIGCERYSGAALAAVAAFRAEFVGQGPEAIPL